MLRRFPCLYFGCERLFARPYNLTQHLGSHRQAENVEAGQDMQQAISFDQTQPSAQPKGNPYAYLRPNNERGTALKQTMALLRQHGHTELLVSDFRLQYDISMDDPLHVLHWSAYGKEDFVRLLGDGNTARSLQQHTSDVEEMICEIFLAYIRQRLDFAGIADSDDRPDRQQMLQSSDAGGMASLMQPVDSASAQVDFAQAEDPLSMQHPSGFLVPTKP